MGCGIQRAMKMWLLCGLFLEGKIPLLGLLSGMGIQIYFLIHKELVNSGWIIVICGLLLEYVYAFTPSFFKSEGWHNSIRSFTFYFQLFLSILSSFMLLQMFVPYMRLPFMHLSEDAYIYMTWTFVDTPQIIIFILLIFHLISSSFLALLALILTGSIMKNRNEYGLIWEEIKSRNELGSKSPSTYRTSFTALNQHEIDVFLEARRKMCRSEKMEENMNISNISHIVDTNTQIFCDLCSKPVEYDKYYIVFLCEHEFHEACISRWMIKNLIKKCAFCPRHPSLPRLISKGDYSNLSVIRGLSTSRGHGNIYIGRHLYLWTAIKKYIEMVKTEKLLRYIFLPILWVIWEATLIWILTIIINTYPNIHILHLSISFLIHPFLLILWSFLIRKEIFQYSRSSGWSIINFGLTQTFYIIISLLLFLQLILSDAVDHSFSALFIIFLYVFLNLFIELLFFHNTYKWLFLFWAMLLYDICILAPVTLILMIKERQFSFLRIHFNLRSYRDGGDGEMAIPLNQHHEIFARAAYGQMLVDNC